jgi:alkylated DNA repair dioxygenase AlkB
MDQLSLFELPALHPAHWPEGLVYEADWLTRDDEAALIGLFARLPFANAKYKSYTARRRVVGYGGRYDFDTNQLAPAPSLIDDLHPLRERVAEWAGLDAHALEHALVSEYAPGTPLGWHRDVPDFEDVVGVSVGGAATLRFRPFPPDTARREDVVKVAVQPRSIYLMRGPSRWAWQHCVAPVDALRWSITFRTATAKRKARR